MTHIEHLNEWCIENECKRDWTGQPSEQTKCAGFAYASSDLAKWLGYTNTSCYVLRLGLTVQDFKTCGELAKAYDASPLPVGIYCMMRDYREQEARKSAPTKEESRITLPQLLKALDDCITDDNAQCIVTCDVAYMIRRFRAINKIARDAIAQATSAPKKEGN